ncbi:MAG TPA: hypothetical protein VFC53_08445 [Dehalococcoidia bacterium]|nr:hypothetical protein [Dehalococcoidia bacterium]
MVNRRVPRVGINEFDRRDSDPWITFRARVTAIDLLLQARGNCLGRGPVEFRAGVIVHDPNPQQILLVEGPRDGRRQARYLRTDEMLLVPKVPRVRESLVAILLDDERLERTPSYAAREVSRNPIARDKERPILLTRALDVPEMNFTCERVRTPGAAQFGKQRITPLIRDEQHTMSKKRSSPPLGLDLVVNSGDAE